MCWGHLVDLLAIYSASSKKYQVLVFAGEGKYEMAASGWCKSLPLMTNPCEA